MKNISKKIGILLFSIFSLTACKADKENDVKNKKNEVLEIVLDTIINDTIKDTAVLNYVEIKKSELKIAPIKNSVDDTEVIDDQITFKQFYKETATYTIDFCYPYLNEKYDPKFENFNTYIETELLKLSEIENNILESQELLCDTTKLNPCREYRIAEYKVFLQNEKHLSVLFYLENYYSNTKTAYYTFETINFDMIKGEILTFEDYFNEGSIHEVLEILNTEIQVAIDSGEMFYECFTVSLDDFTVAKNSFVFNDDVLIYYFNDCVMCPSFVGTYEIAISLEKLKPVLKKYWTDKFSS